MRRREFTRLLVLAPAAFAHRARGDDRPTFNVRRLGAVADGATDDKLAFLTAITSAARVGGIVFVPAGNYRVSIPLRIPSGVMMAGEGHASMILHEGDLIVLWCVGAKGVEIRNLQISGRFAHGLLIQQSTDIVVHGCSFVGAIIPRFNYAAGIYIVESSGITIELCHLEGNGLEGERVSSDIQCDGTDARSNRISIIGNVCRSTLVTSNIRCYDMSYSQIRQNSVSGARRMTDVSGGYGIVVYETGANVGGCRGNCVDGNEVTDTQGSGIYLNRSHSSRVVANHIMRAGTHQLDVSLPVAGIALNQSEFGTVALNKIESSGSAGIAIASNGARPLTVVVSENTVQHALGIGIHLRGTVSEVSVVRNTVTDSHGGIGSFSEHAQDRIEIRDNKVMNTGGKRAAISLQNASRSAVVGNELEDNEGLDLDVRFVDASSSVSDNRQLSHGILFVDQERVRIYRP